MPIEAIIFDMDGTLIEQRIDFADIRAQLGIAPQDGLLEAIAAMPPHDAETANAYLLECELSAARTAVLQPGAEEILAYCRSCALPTALLTRNTRQAVEIVHARFPALSFDHVRTREDGVIKPEPDGILATCERLGVSPGKTCCVGDFEFDIIAANAAGCRSVLYLPAGSPPPWADAADDVIRSLSALKSILEK